MRLTLLSLLTASLAPLALADVKFTSPAAGATLKGGTAVTIEWADSGTAPALSALTTYQIFLCAGGNTDGTFEQLLTITSTGTFANGNTASGTIPTGTGASTPANAYFFKIISVASEGGTVTNYSPRFSLSGMTGTFSSSISTGLTSFSGTSGPDTENAVANDASSADGDMYNVAYTAQTGLTRYAPMQSLPPTKITKTNVSPLNPTSSADIATTFLPIVTSPTLTVTQSQTFTISQKENTASPVAQPSDDMQRFLNRWRD